MRSLFFDVISGACMGFVLMWAFLSVLPYPA